MDELDLSGKKYISSKRAAEITGYAKDYIGQLARAGKVSATRFGRAWYVEESSILAHVNADNAQKSPEIKVSAPQKAAPITLPQSFYKPSQFPNTWGNVRYLEDHSDLLPAVSKRVVESAEITNKNLASSVTVDKVFEKNVPIKTPIETKIHITRMMPKRATAVTFDLPKRAPATPMIRPVRAVQVRPSFALGPHIAMAGAAAVLLVAYVSIFTLWKADTANLANTVYAASAFSAFQSAFGAFLASPLVETGLAGVVGFFNLIFHSFWIFVSKGITFLQGLF